jgi:hypothetical protein
MCWFFYNTALEGFSNAFQQAHASAEVNLHNDSSDLELHKNMHQTEMLHHIWVRTCKLTQ